LPATLWMTDLPLLPIALWAVPDAELVNECPQKGDSL